MASLDLLPLITLPDENDSDDEQDDDNNDGNGDTSPGAALDLLALLLAAAAGAAAALLARNELHELLSGADGQANRRVSAGQKQGRRKENLRFIHGARN